MSAAAALYGSEIVTLVTMESPTIAVTVDQSVFKVSLQYNVLLSTGEQEIPGLTDKTIPRRLGPKRASHIRKLFNLSKEDDVRQYVVRRPLPEKEGKVPGGVPGDVPGGVPGGVPGDVPGGVPGGVAGNVPALPHN